MTLPTIPIIMSFGNPDKYLPPRSFINVFNFTSIASLGRYISYLNQNYSAYLEYMTWKNTG